MVYMFNTDTLLLTGTFNNFQNICLEIYKLDPAKFFSSLAHAWQ